MIKSLGPELCLLYNHSLQRVKKTPFINKPPLLVTHPFLVNPPPPLPISWDLSLSLIVSKYIASTCIKPCYEHLIKATEEWWF